MFAYSLSVLRACLVGFVVILSFSSVSAGTVNGRVVDDGKMPPKNGLSGVDIFFKTENGKKMPAGMTRADGKYTIKDLPPGKITIYFQKPRYGKNEISGEVKEGVTVWPTARMWTPISEVVGYYRKVAINIHKRTSDAKNERIALSNEWMQMAHKPPVSKWKISVELFEVDKEIKGKLPIVKHYLAVNLGAIARSQSTLTSAANGEIKVPGKSFLEEAKINEKVFGEIILWKLIDDSIPIKKRRAFFDNFNREWEGTNVQKSIKLWRDRKGAAFRK